MENAADQVSSLVLEKFTNGLYIVTARKKAAEMETRDRDYIAAGTIAWATQTSFEPPMVTVAVQRGSDLAETIARSQQFALHVLGADQKEMAKVFSGDSVINQTEKTINGYAYHKGMNRDLPIVRETIGYLECELEEMVNTAGDHILFIGKVVGGEIHNKKAQPLHEWRSGLHYGG